MVMIKASRTLKVGRSLTNPPLRRYKHLCANVGYTGALALKVIEEHGYIAHVKGRGQEATVAKVRDQLARLG